jgi:hypothetical protein
LPALNPDFLYAALDATAYAAFVKESRKKRAGATKLHRKSGEALDPESRLFHKALKRSFPRINAGAPTSNLDKSGDEIFPLENLKHPGPPDTIASRRRSPTVLAFGVAELIHRRANHLTTSHCRKVGRRAGLREA